MMIVQIQTGTKELSLCSKSEILIYLRVYSFNLVLVHLLDYSYNFDLIGTSSSISHNTKLPIGCFCSIFKVEKPSLVHLSFWDLALETEVLSPNAANFSIIFICCTLNLNDLFSNPTYVFLNKCQLVKSCQCKKI